MDNHFKEIKTSVYNGTSTITKVKCTQDINPENRLIKITQNDSFKDESVIWLTPQQLREILEGAK